MSGTGYRDGEEAGGVGALVKGLRARLLRRAALAAGLWLAVVLLLTLALAWVLSGPSGWSRGSAVPLLLDVGLLGATVAAGAVLWALRRRRLSDVRIARDLDRIGGFGRGTVLGSLELSRATPPGVSSALARRSADGVLRALPSEAERLTGPLGSSFRTWSRRAAGLLALALPGVVLLAVTSPDRSLSAWSGLLRPATVLATPPLPALRVEPAGGRLARGSELEVWVEAPGRKRVRMLWQFDGDVARGREADVEGGRARFDLGALEAPVEYRATAPDGARSRRFRMVPEDPLLLTELRVEITFPPHTGRAPQQYRREVPPLEIPLGTEIRLAGRASRPLRSAGLERTPREGGRVEEAETAEGEEDAVELSVTGERFSGQWMPRESGRYAWSLRGEDGAEPASVPEPLEVTMVGDSAPSVELLSPGRDTVLPLDRRQPLVIRAVDDYGLERLELVAYRVSSFGERSDPVVQRLRTGGVRAAVARPVLDVSDWELLPGDTVRYRARVTDNAPRAQIAESREYVLRVARGSQAARELQEELESAYRAVDSLATEAGRAAQETRDLERRRSRPRGGGGGSPMSRLRESREPQSGSSASRQETSFESREEVRRAVERQEELASVADSIRSELAEARRALEEFALADPELRRDLEELESLMSEAAPERQREALRRTSERLDQMDARELQEALERLAQSQESFRERVEESLERFRRAAAEQDFRATAREARDLADEEAALADAMEDGERGEARARQQEGLTDRASELQDRMEALEQRLSRLGEQDAREGVQQAREGVQDASGEMERASDSSRGQRAARAAEAARSAGRQLQRSAEGLDSARQRMERQQAEQIQRAFQRTSTEALSLARRQGELEERMRGADGEGSSDLRGDEAALLEGLRNLSSSLSGPASQAPEAGRRVQQAMEQAMESVRRTLDAMEGRGGTPSPTAASTEAVEALNRLARSAARASGQPGGQGGSGSSPGLQQQLQETARQQGGLVEQAAGLQPLQLGQPSLESRLGEMAGEQESVADELESLARQPGSGEALGDLGTMAEEARELAERLEGGRLDPETVRRQERLFHRLLDAGRSLEKDELSRVRRSRAAEATAPAEVEPLTSADRGGARFSLPGAEVLQALPPAQRALIVRYFERLNRGQGGSVEDGGAR